jgi:hypothetical protein
MFLTVFYFSAGEVFSPVPEIIDPVFMKTSQNARFLLSENERFGLVFVKTGSINSGTGAKRKIAGKQLGPLLLFNPLWTTMWSKISFTCLLKWPVLCHNLDRPFWMACIKRSRT